EYPLDRPPARGWVRAGLATVQLLHAGWRENFRVAVNVQPDKVMGEIDHEHADVRVLQDVAQACHHAVAPDLGVGDGALIEDPQEAGRSGPEAAVAFTGRVAGGDERHLHAPDELHHLRGQLAAELAAIELAGPVLRAVQLLQDVLAPRSRPRRRGSALVQAHGDLPGSPGICTMVCCCTLHWP